MQKTSVLDRPRHKPRQAIYILSEGKEYSADIADVESNYDLIGLAAMNELDHGDLRRHHPSKNELVELQTFAKSTTKQTLASMDGDEEPFVDICCYLNGR